MIMGKLREITCGDVSIYGKWDDVTDNQFLVIWHEAGARCTVLILGGYDYGGGVTIFSDVVPYKEAEAVLNAAYDYPEGDTKKAMEELVSKYQTGRGDTDD